MRVSVIIPTLNEAPGIALTLSRVRQAGECELVVVDGGSSDGTADIARAYADSVLTAARGRAQQMNAGAHAATGEVLLFLHADTVLPAGFATLVRQALHDPTVVGGRFDVRLDAEGWPFRMIETLMNARSRWSKICTGDQALFLQRETFRALGGFPELELMEDLEFSRRLKRAGRIACLREQVRTSARRWQRGGVFRTIALMWTLRLAYFCGVPPRRLKAWYAETR
ncbi:MAG: TIGR04283 family arsenosugar biosynthesis glycosyltransferase [Deltaproteobacteria bacterium]|nr:TIGR04283 family arsenosugar biosynthesis glycosyltransferase [Deltaproteobacteria bacterium]